MKIYNILNKLLKTFVIPLAFLFSNVAFSQLSCGEVTFDNPQQDPFFK